MPGIVCVHHEKRKQASDVLYHKNVRGLKLLSERIQNQFKRVPLLRVRVPLDLFPRAHVRTTFLLPTLATFYINDRPTVRESGPIGPRATIVIARFVTIRFTKSASIRLIN